jgi:hypothetical protein
MTKAILFSLLTLALLLGGCATHNLIAQDPQEGNQLILLETVEIKEPYIPTLAVIERNSNIDLIRLKNYKSESCDIVLQNKLKKAIADYILTHYPTRCPFKTEEIAHHVVELCDEHEIDVNIIIAIMQAESQFVPEATNRRSKAAGLMQVMPFWAKDFNIKNKQELYEIETNIYAGIRVLKIFLDEHNGNMTKALYRYVGGSKKYPNQVLGISKKVSVYIASYPG